MAVTPNMTSNGVASQQGGTYVAVSKARVEADQAEVAAKVELGVLRAGRGLGVALGAEQPAEKTAAAAATEAPVSAKEATPEEAATATSGQEPATAEQEATTLPLWREE